jgi:hypothetical protein
MQAHCLQVCHNRMQTRLRRSSSVLTIGSQSDKDLIFFHYYLQSNDNANKMGTELLFDLMKTVHHISSTTVSMRNKLWKKYKGQQCHYFTLYYNIYSC